MKQRNAHAARTIDYWITEITNDLQAESDQGPAEAAPRKKAPRPLAKASFMTRTRRAISQFFLPRFGQR